MTIEEFQSEASKAFESDAAVNVITTITVSRHTPTPEFCVILKDSSDDVHHGTAKNARDAINECKRRRAQAHEEKVKKAKRLLGIP